MSTRSRPYRKNDQAHVEQKNGAVVRRMVGYRRYSGIAAATELARLYSSMRLYVNFFEPSFKLMEKTRDGARGTKRYHPPLAPFQRVQAHPAVLQAAKDALVAQFEQLDPVALLHDIRRAQARLTALADATPFAENDGNPKADVEDFLNGLRHAWKEGEVRPTSRRKPPIPPRSAPEVGDGPIRSQRSPTISRRGSTRTRQKPDMSFCAGFRPPIQMPILTCCCAPYSAA